MRADRAILFKLATNERLEHVVKALPGGEANAYRAASRYVAGRTREEALAKATELLGQGHGVSLDLFGELSTSTTDARRVADDYLALADSLPKASPDSATQGSTDSPAQASPDSPAQAPTGDQAGSVPADAWLSVDLSHLALDVDPRRTADLLAQIAGALPPGRRIQVGAEDLRRAEEILTCVLDAAGRGLADRLGATIQANLLRSPSDVEALTEAGVHVRLVKGAYVEPRGVHPYGEPTDIAYLQLAHQLAAAGTPWSLATHDGRLREAVLLALGPVPVEQLLGVRPEVLDDLRSRGVPTRVYLPYGPDWFRYWLRRIAESRGA
ncbi:Proline dehydrogenase [Kribbella flavida DSM 17836]|uniref:Proline dehydrogenase n=1 Tax=Kribbella flavida (strain DSM 17836 / JCM 10339 / NBRC 14399) TaxID=479435 RepID=D2PRQ5_KRIFD|nr:proline dehydrogenase family protein [Kribbella flavida]ADB29235.1 Proline dehydrogenase [Kribbella flavida DSM 17836]